MHGVMMRLQADYRRGRPHGYRADDIKPHIAADEGSKTVRLRKALNEVSNCCSTAYGAGVIKGVWVGAEA